MWKIEILTLFPDLYPGCLDHSILRRARKSGIWDISVHNLRDYSLSPHCRVDDNSYGLGSGMVVRPDVLGNAIDDLFIENRNPIIYLTPRGRVFNQELSHKMINDNPCGVNLICGRYEGIDERVIKEYNLLEISIGDYILSSGDIASFAFLDSCIRLLPDVLGNSSSLEEESFSVTGEYKNLLEYPLYTRPKEWRGFSVPDILTSGNHRAIDAWKLSEAKKKTKNMRPDLWIRHKKDDDKF